MAKQGTGLFGWCMTNQHSTCWYQFKIIETGVVHTCTCACHKKEDKK